MDETTHIKEAHTNKKLRDKINERKNNIRQ